jgi:hypothetical protein
MENLYDITVQTIDGEKITLESFKHISTPFIDT